MRVTIWANWVYDTLTHFRITMVGNVILSYAGFPISRKLYEGALCLPCEREEFANCLFIIPFVRYSLCQGFSRGNTVNNKRYLVHL